MTVAFGIHSHHRAIAAEARAAGHRPPTRTRLRPVPHMIALWSALVVLLLLVGFVPTVRPIAGPLAMVDLLAIYLMHPAYPLRTGRFA